jgi:hypothetical protein
MGGLDGARLGHHLQRVHHGGVVRVQSVSTDCFRFGFVRAGLDAVANPVVPIGGELPPLSPSCAISLGLPVKEATHDVISRPDWTSI